MKLEGIHHITCITADAPDNRVHHARTRRPAPSARVLEESDVGTDAPHLVRVEEVVDGRVILVDRFLDEAEPERADVEVDVLRRVRGDAGDVVDAFELHVRRLPSFLTL